MKKFIPTFLLKLRIKLAIAVCFFCSCAEVKPWQRAWLNDPAMRPDSSPQSFDQYVHSIREGAMFPDGEKGAGGCGCN